MKTEYIGIGFIEAILIVMMVNCIDCGGCIKDHIKESVKQECLK